MSRNLLVENDKVIWAIAPKDWTGAASVGDYVSMKNYPHLTIIIQTGAWAAGTAAITLTQSLTVAAGSEKALGFSWQWNDVAATGTLVKTAVTANTFTIGVANKLYVIEIDASSLDKANNFDVVTVKGATPGANADLYGAIYILSRSRYKDATPPSAIID